MSYISVAQYASSEDTKKTAPKAVFFVSSELYLKVLQVFFVIILCGKTGVG